MPWFRVDDGFDNHPKTLKAGNAAIGMWTRVGVYCAKYCTDGFVPDAILRSYGSPRERARLVAAGLLEIVPGGARLHDYLDWNQSCEQVKADRAANVERQRRFRESRRDITPRNGVTNTDSNAVSHTAPPIPSPLSTYIPLPLTGGVIGRRVEDD